jgi:hypothetical protein
MTLGWHERQGSLSLAFFYGVYMKLYVKIKTAKTLFLYGEQKKNTLSIYCTHEPARYAVVGRSRMQDILLYGGSIAAGFLPRWPVLLSGRDRYA